MRLYDSENMGQKNLYDYITATHMFSILLMFSALIISKQFFADNVYPVVNIRVFLFIGAVVLAAVILYNTKESVPLHHETPLSLLDVLYSGFPLLVGAIILFIIGEDQNYTRVILLVPVIITASTFGKKSGLLMTSSAAVILLIHSTMFSVEMSFTFIIESNLILICVMYILGWFIGGIRDLERLQRQQLIDMANTDVLTGLYNHRCFQERLKQLVQSSSEKQPLSLIFLDIDHFKQYNDSFGHIAGDKVLASMGQLLIDIVGEAGFAARYGGEEFVVVLANCDGRKAADFGENIRAQVSEETFKGQEYQPEGKVTVSCGIATYPTHAQSAQDLIKLADEALYRAKNLNKNKVELYYSIFDSLDVKGDEKELVNSIRTLVSVINGKDRYTYGHSERVMGYAVNLAEKIGLTKEEIYLLRYAAFLHDIGKIEIERDILNKPGKLTDEEWHILQHHPQWGSDIVKSVRTLQPAAEVILYHHENYDGSGYPHGISGQDIPLLSRIIRVVDSYDAMITNRPYKGSFSKEEAIAELKRCSDSLFDPDLVKILIDIINGQSSSAV